MMTPTRAPVNIIGIIMNSFSYWISVFPFSTFFIEFQTFPTDDPKIAQEDTIVAYFGE